MELTAEQARYKRLYEEEKAKRELLDRDNAEADRRRAEAARRKSVEASLEEFRIPPHWADRVSGTTPEEIRQNALSLAEDLGLRQRRTKPYGNGTPPYGPNKDKVNRVFEPPKPEELERARQELLRTNPSRYL
jgi:hypothetical protein